MANVKGIVKVIKKNDYGFYSVKIDDTWYGTGSKKELSGIVTGDAVEGEFELEKGKYKTITPAGLKKATGSPAAEAGSTGSGSKLSSDSGMSKAEWAQKDLRIQYQHAQKVAVSFLAVPGVLAAAGLEKAKPADKMELIEALFDKFTAQVYGDIGTFGAVTRVNAPAVDPAAPASDDDNDE